MNPEPNEQRQLAAAALTRRTGCAPAYAAEIADGLAEDEIAALAALPDDPAVEPAMRLVVKTSRMRQALEPLMLEVLNAFDALEMNQVELHQLANRFATAGGETQLDRAAADSESLSVIGPRPAAVRTDPRNRRVKRSLGDA